jgi:cellulose biosynthesis protein BcsQ
MANAYAIAVWGSPNSGKTTISCALAAQLSSKKKNVAIVCCDDMVPTIPTIFPQNTKNIYDKSTRTRSIGKILATIAPSDNDFLEQLTTVNNVGRIVLVGYAYGESFSSYARPTEHDVYNFYIKLGEMVDFIIIDCTSRLDNKLTSIGLYNADVIVKTCGASYKDIVFFASNLPNVPGKSVALSDHINVFANARRNDAIDETRSFYGDIHYIIKHDDVIQKNYDNGELLLTPFPKAYKKTINEMIEGMNFVG